MKLQIFCRVPLICNAKVKGHVESDVLTAILGVNLISDIFSLSTQIIKSQQEVMSLCWIVCIQVQKYCNIMQIHQTPNMTSKIVQVFLIKWRLVVFAGVKAFLSSVALFLLPQQISTRKVGSDTRRALRSVSDTKVAWPRSGLDWKLSGYGFGWSSRWRACAPAFERHQHVHTARWGPLKGILGNSESEGLKRKQTKSRNITDVIM